MTAAHMQLTILGTQYSRKYCIVDLDLDMPSSHVQGQVVLTR